LPLLR
jgi:hypothetical protein